MDWFHAIILGIVEGLTEFLPVSSTGHLTIVEKLFNYKLDDPGIVAFTAVIQVGSILAAVWFFRKDIVRIARAWCKGVFNKKYRHLADYTYGWAIIIGSIPIAVVGLVFKHQIETLTRSLWVVAVALIVWSFVMLFADKVGSQKRHEQHATWRDTFVIGLTQCLALIPGVSRSGSTIAAGLLRGFDRTSATRLAFFLGIPALLAAGALEGLTKAADVSHGVGWGPTIIATIVAFITAYIAITWLLKYVSKHNFGIFIGYRIGLGLLIIGLLATGVLAAV